MESNSSKKIRMSPATPYSFTPVGSCQLDGLSFIDIPTPKTSEYFKSSPPIIGLRTFTTLGTSPSDFPSYNTLNRIFFSFESIPGIDKTLNRLKFFDIHQIHEHDMVNYYNDLVFILEKNYGFTNLNQNLYQDSMHFSKDWYFHINLYDYKSL